MEVCPLGKSLLAVSESGHILLYDVNTLFGCLHQVRELEGPGRGKREGGGGRSFIFLF